MFSSKYRSSESSCNAKRPQAGWCEFRVAEEGLDHVHGAVRGVVVDHDYIVREVRFLGQGRPEGIADGFHAVLARDDDGRLEGELPFRDVHGLERRRQVTADGLEVVRDGLFHLDLGLPVLRIHVIELLFAGLAEVRLYLIIKVFTDVLEPSLLRNFQPEVIKTGGRIVRRHPGCRLLQG